MALAKRIILFLALNFLVIFMISLILQLLHVRPYLEAHGLNYPSLLTFCFIWGVGGALISLSLSRIMAKWMMGVQIIDPKTIDPDAKQLLQTVYHLADAAGVPHPQVGVFRSKLPIGCDPERDAADFGLVMDAIGLNLQHDRVADLVRQGDRPVEREVGAEPPRGRHPVQTETPVRTDRTGVEVVDAGGGYHRPRVLPSPPSACSGRSGRTSRSHPRSVRRGSLLGRTCRHVHALGQRCP